MNKNKNLIHHEILNVITLINFEISGSTLAETKKKDLLKDLKLLTLLINYEDVILGEKRELFKKPVHINETLETIQMVQEKHMKTMRVKFNLPTDDLTADIDHKIFQEALEQIILRLMNTAKKIDFRYRGNTLEIHHDGEALNMKKVELMECLKDRQQFLLQLPLKLLELNGLKVRGGKAMIAIDFT